MIKKILPISIFVLVFVSILLIWFQSTLNKGGSGNSSLTPTIVPGKQGSGYTPLTGKTTGGNAVKQLSPEELKKKLPIIAPDFTLDYSPRMQRYVVTETGEGAANSYNDWIEQNPAAANELQGAVVTKQTVEELNAVLDNAKKNQQTPEEKAVEKATAFTSTFKMLNSLPYILMNIPTPQSSLNPTTPPKAPSPTNGASNPTPTKVASNPPASGTGYVYYSQCSGPYDALPLPNGCTICYAGCGPTSAAMLLSTFIDKSLTPPKTIDLMDKAGVRIGCYGSYVSEIYSYLKRRGDLKVTDFIIPSEQALSAKSVAKDFKGYTDAGYAVFVLANFKVGSGGHYFLVTAVNDNGDILAYDPYYGKQQTPPINENRYAPAPYYRYAFAVKKS